MAKATKITRHESSHAGHVKPLAIAEQSGKHSLTAIAGAQRAMDVINKIGGCVPIAKYCALHAPGAQIEVAQRDASERQELQNTLKQCGIDHALSENGLRIAPASLLNYLEKHVAQVKRESDQAQRRGSDDFVMARTLLGAYELLSAKEKRANVLREGTVSYTADILRSRTLSKTTLAT